MTRLIQTAFVLTVAVACAMVTCSCASKGDPTFMNNASAAINGGPVMLPGGQVSFSPGQNTPEVHPFFGGAR